MTSQHIADATKLLDGIKRAQDDFHALLANGHTEAAEAHAEAMPPIVSAAAVQALAHATLALVEQQRIANRLRLAAINLEAERAYLSNGGHALDFRVRDYLTPADWEDIEVIPDA